MPVARYECKIFIMLYKIYSRIKDKHCRKISFLILFSFLSSFVSARLYALLAAPMLTFRGIHIHHLNYGIVFLAVAGFLSFYFSNSKYRNKVIFLYGIGLGLTFDEFALWLHLEEHYWERVSYDAIVIITVILLNAVFFGDRWAKIYKKISLYFVSMMVKYKRKIKDY